jgi:small subunit ribosomal protein S4
VTGEALLTLLERRLDNVVYRLGFALSRAHARQLVNHGHVRVMRKGVERVVDIPSFRVQPGDEISVTPGMQKNIHVQEAIRTAAGRAGRPAWLELIDAEKCRGRVVSLPTRADISPDIRENLIVELYSK